MPLLSQVFYPNQKAIQLYRLLFNMSRNAKTKHNICITGNVGAQCFAPAFNKACAQRTP